MSRFHFFVLSALVSSALWAAGCNSDDVQENPSFMAGHAGSPAGGAPTEPGPTLEAGAGAGAVSTGGAPEPGTGGVPSTAGGGGQPPEEPPYDCVLHPKTHLEIINACTDSVRIEKHPDLPPIRP